MALSDYAPRRTHRLEQLRREGNDTRDVPLPSPALVLDVPGPAHGLEIALVMDVQARRGVPIDHLRWYGEYLARRQPDVVLCIGDFWDMPSLSVHNAPGSLASERQRYVEDIGFGKMAMDYLMEPIAAAAGWNPTLVFVEGNHEYRIERAIAQNPQELMGLISREDYALASWGWQVIPFLQPIIIGGVAFSHYFPSGVKGMPLNTAAGILRKFHQSGVAGHLQGRDISYARNAQGQAITAIISGSFYQHAEEYMSPLANQHWRGTYYLHEVKDGAFDEMALSIGWLKRKFS